MLLENTVNKGQEGKSNQRKTHIFRKYKRTMRKVNIWVKNKNFLFLIFKIHIKDLKQKLYHFIVCFTIYTNVTHNNDSTKHTHTHTTGKYKHTKVLAFFHILIEIVPY